MPLTNRLEGINREAYLNRFGTGMSWSYQTSAAEGGGAALLPNWPYDMLQPRVVQVQLISRAYIKRKACPASLHTTSPCLVEQCPIFNWIQPCAFRG